MNAPSWTGTQWIALYAVTLLLIGALDGLWLGWLAKDLYQREMGDLMAESPRLVPAAVFYVAYPVGVVFFALAAVSPATGSVLEAFMRCAALGLLAYATYDLTNMSVIRGFSVKLAFVDMAWGAFVTGVGGAAAFAVVRWWSARGA